MGKYLSSAEEIDIVLNAFYDEEYCMPLPFLVVTEILLPPLVILLLSGALECHRRVVCL